MMSALPSKQAFQRHFVQSSSLLLNALLRNKRYPLEEAPLPSLFSYLFLNFSSAVRPPKKLPACRRLLFPLLHCYTRATKEIGDVCTKATKKATVLDKIDGTLRPVLPFPQIKDEKKQLRSQGSLLLGRILVFAQLIPGKGGFNQSVN